MAIIVFDPGHGGHDPGAIGKKSKEKDNVLKVAKKLKSLLESYGYTVKLTRDTDKYLTLSERARKANNWGANYFISLHDNAAVNKSAKGFETFVHNGNVSPKTINFQKAVHQAIAKNIGTINRGMKRANFAVIRETKMPAVLIEYAFITNLEDERILTDKVNQLAEWTCEGIIDAIGGTIKSKPSKPESKPNKPASPKPSKPKSASLTVDGKWGSDTTRALQKALGTPVDGVISNQPRNAVTNALYGGVTFGSSGSPMVRALQRKIGAKADGKLGPETVRKLQKYLGTPVDGVISRPSSPMVKELQCRLNKGTF